MKTEKLEVFDLAGGMLSDGQNVLADGGYSGDAFARAVKREIRLW